MATPAEMVQLYQDAEIAVLAGKSYSIGGRSLSMENLEEIRKGRAEWEIRAGVRKSARAYRFIPRDG